jgi:hypothetical protein
MILLKNLVLYIYFIQKNLFLIIWYIGKNKNKNNCFTKAFTFFVIHYDFFLTLPYSLTKIFIHDIIIIYLIIMGLKI